MKQLSGLGVGGCWGFSRQGLLLRQRHTFPEGGRKMAWKRKQAEPVPCRSRAGEEGDSFPHSLAYTVHAGFPWCAHECTEQRFAEYLA